MDSDNQETLRREDEGTNRILEAIAGLRGDVSELRGEISELRGEVSDLRGEVSDLRGEVSELRGELKEMKGLQLTFDVRLDRLESMAHESLQVAFSVRADVKVLRAEVTAWAADVADLQRKVA
ncbi:MAG: hypothetical protein M3384_04390 [Acidobacteriota bacterium]|nr:hypothetical protein [Acidobacteriota bacterium]